MIGRTLAAPLAAGEPVLPLRLVGPDLAAAYAPRVAVPVRLPDADVAALLRVGDRIDLLVSDPQAAVGGSSGGSAGGGLSGSASVVATGVPVLAAPGAPTGADGVTGSGTAGPGPAGFGGRLVVVGVLPAEVPRVADAAVRGFLSIAWTR